MNVKNRCDLVGVESFGQINQRATVRGTPGDVNYNTSSLQETVVKAKDFVTKLTSDMADR